jgi:hypothetical protein
MASLTTAIHYLAGAETTRVEGLTITGGADGASAVTASPLVLRNCRVTQNPEVAISIREQSLTLIDCVVADNDHVGLAGIGALDVIDGDVVCIRTVFERNGWNAIDMTTLAAGGNSLVMEDCVVADHRNRGVMVWDASSVEIEGCLFERNFVSFSGGGGGLQLLRVTTGAIRFSTFAFDSGGGGGGIQLGSSSVRVENCTFYRCHGENSSGAISIADTDAGALNNVVVGTTGQRGAVRLVGAVPHPDTGCNLLWDNEGGHYFDAWVPAPTDVYANPQLCDPLNGDYTLSESSPAAAANSPTCGQLGAFGVGCGTVSVESTSWGRLKSLYRSDPD